MRVRLLNNFRRAVSLLLHILHIFNYARISGPCAVHSPYNYLPCIMVEATPPTSRRRLVGQSLLYAISVFASLGVFLVSDHSPVVSLYPRIFYSISSLAMIKGVCFMSVRHAVWNALNLLHGSVMSGIITNPYFIKYFNTPSAIELGTMVAVLELGALGMHNGRLAYCR